MIIFQAMLNWKKYWNILFIHVAKSSKTDYFCQAINCIPETLQYEHWLLKRVFGAAAAVDCRNPNKPKNLPERNQHHPLEVLRHLLRLDLVEAVSNRFLLNDVLRGCLVSPGLSRPPGCKWCSHRKLQRSAINCGATGYILSARPVIYCRA